MRSSSETYQKLKSRSELISEQANLIADLESRLAKEQERSTKLGETLTEVRLRTSERAKQSMIRHIAQMQASIILKVFKEWSLYTRERKKIRQGMLRFLTRMQNQTLSKVFDAWHEQIEEEKRNRIILSRFVSRMKNGSLAKCMNSWQQYTYERISMHGKKAKACAPTGIAAANVEIEGGHF